MNKDYVLYNLRDALKEIEDTIKDIESDPEYGEGEYSVAVNHLYHHVNTAWNARYASVAEVDECSEESFQKWRQFPQDVEMQS